MLVVAKTTEKYGELSYDMDKLVEDANKEIQRLQNMISDGARDRQKIIEQNAALKSQLDAKADYEKELNKKISHYEEQTSAATLEDAAAHNVNRAVQHLQSSHVQRSSPRAGFDNQSGVASRFPNVPMHGRRGSSGSNGSSGMAQRQGYGWGQSRHACVGKRNELTFACYMQDHK